jgi:hypothetical protein
MSHRKPLAALAAAAAAIAVAVPATSASAATYPTIQNPVLQNSTAMLCTSLSFQTRFAAFGNPTLAGLLGQTSNYQGCAAPTP